MNKKNNKTMTGLVEAGTVNSEEKGRIRKIVVDGMINFSFGKNGKGISDEFIQIGNIINQLSEDNHVYLEESFIDACDDVYDLKFKVVPHDDNKWMIEEKLDKPQDNYKQNPQNTWKPSDEQMRILDLAIRCGINRGTTEETTLVSLFNDLKKLKE